MKLVIDARESGTSTGRYIDKLVEYLHKSNDGLEITVLTKAHRLKFFKELSPNFLIVKSNYREFTFGEQYGLVWQLYGLKNDLVHFSMPQQPVLYFGKSVTTIHDLTTARFRNPSKNWLVFGLKQQVYRWVIKRVARKSACIITPSEFVKQDVVQYAKIDPAKISVTYEAADKITARAEPLKNLAGQKFIMYVGRPQPHKNLERLVDAFAVVRQTHPDLKLVLAGKNDVLFQRLQKKVQKRGQDDVVFTDFISDGQLRWLYENCAAYVFPSLSEGFGLPGLEAMAHGAPVASSNATCLPEVYGSAAHYFDPLDAADMAAKISQVLDDPKLRRELIKKGHAQAAKYSWERMAKQTLAVYNRALEINT